MCNWFKRKRVTFYMLTSKDNPDLFYCITTSYWDCQEYLDKLLKLKYDTHYKMWCEIRNLDYNDNKVWMKYSSDCIDDEEFDQYEIRKIWYEHKALASIIRMFAGCVPLDCSFESPKETKYFAEKVKKQVGGKVE